MVPKHFELPLLLLLIELLATVSMEELGELSPWEFSNCPYKASSDATPTMLYTPRLLNLRKLGNLATKTWIMFSGTVSYKDEVGLTAGYLYSVTKRDPEDSSDHSYTFTRRGTTHVYTGELLQLDTWSYGFVSCDEDEATAMKEADLWWRKCPYSSLTIILMALGALFIVVLIVATTVCIIRRRRARRAANLYPLSKRMRPKRDTILYV
ncbi:uncharacterized protein LOC135223816 [Macrobrachium nipponense]|uniref:uncharacterized protein LOC135223816 n=1 Tax=Macrobrachium nipponense TaxID=159736 RepID=UPI0030C7C83B